MTMDWTYSSEDINVMQITMSDAGAELDVGPASRSFVTWYGHDHSRCQVETELRFWLVRGLAASQFTSTFTFNFSLPFI